jgi:hypothetical protein
MLLSKTRCFSNEKSLYSNIGSVLIIFHATQHESNIRNESTERGIAITDNLKSSVYRLGYVRETELVLTQEFMLNVNQCRRS